MLLANQMAAAAERYRAGRRRPAVEDSPTVTPEGQDMAPDEHGVERAAHLDGRTGQPEHPGRAGGYQVDGGRQGYDPGRGQRQGPGQQRHRQVVRAEHVTGASRDSLGRQNVARRGGTPPLGVRASEHHRHPQSSGLEGRFLAAAARAATAVAAAIVGLADDGPVAVGADGAPTEAADPRAEDAAVAELAGLGLPIVSEEAGPVGGRRPMSGEAWIALDPLDGSRNFRAGLPPFATAMGLVGGDGRPRAGLVAELTTGRRWWAATGGGAWVDGRPARPRPVPILLCPCPAPGDALPSAPGYDRVRVSGSTTSDLCRVADGSAGAFVDLTRGVVHVHDLAGPLAVLAEAGAAVVSAEPEPLLVADPGRRMRLVAAWSAAEAQSLQLQCRTV